MGSHRSLLLWCDCTVVFKRVLTVDTRPLCDWAAGMDFYRLQTPLPVCVERLHCCVWTLTSNTLPPLCIWVMRLHCCVWTLTSNTLPPLCIWVMRLHCCVWTLTSNTLPPLCIWVMRLHCCVWTLTISRRPPLFSCSGTEVLFYHLPVVPLQFPACAQGTASLAQWLRGPPRERPTRGRVIPVT